MSFQDHHSPTQSCPTQGRKKVGSFGTPIPSALPPLAALPGLVLRFGGAQVFADHGSTVVACESKWSGLALGARAGTQPLTRRDDAPAAVAILQFKPAFLILSAGLRRHQGKIAWMGRDPSGVRPRMRKVPDLKWVSAVRTAAARRLAVSPDASEARSAWRSAVAAAPPRPSGQGMTDTLLEWMSFRESGRRSDLPVELLSGERALRI